MYRPLLAALVTVAVVCPARAQVVIVPSGPQIGSSNPIAARPTVPRPPGTPCTVPLFNEFQFVNFNYQTFSYAPPAGCPGPWAKVVFTADFTVSAGNQYDRTAAFYLGHANLYYGTTAEPSSTLSPSWHVERDVTDLSALFLTAQSGEADLGNFVGTSGGIVYDGIIYANAALEFYPLAEGQPAPRTPSLIVPFPNAAGGAATLSSTASQLSQTLTLPANTERVFLDVIAQSQGGDEFWYTCVPTDVSSELQSCANTAFREVEVTIDNQPAGVAPVYPWIFTGGIDPFLWQPIPGVQTLDFRPYRVDLTPFAGVLANGQAHTFALSVFNANNYFLATANLLVTTDPGAASVTGRLQRNTLTAAPSPVVNENLKTGPTGAVSGSVTVTSARDYVIEGYVQTSHGRVDTTVLSHAVFRNRQEFLIGASSYTQGIHQLTEVRSQTLVADPAGVRSAQTSVAYPLELAYTFSVNADGSAQQKTRATQSYVATTARAHNAVPVSKSAVSSEVSANDTLLIDSSGNLTGNTGQSSSAHYVERTAAGTCFARTLSSAAGVLTSATTSVTCPPDSP